VFTLLVLACVATTARPDATSDPAGARQLLALVNEERAKKGREPLARDDRLAGAALKHAQLMAEKRMLSHQFSGEPSLRLRVAETSVRLDRSGENVAYDTNVDQAHIGLMNSPPHRANILSPDFNAIGIAVVRRGEYIYVVEDFAHRLPEMTESQVEKDVAANFNRLRRDAGQQPAQQARVASLRQAACAMARNDQVNAQAIEVPAARHVLTFTMSDPDQLPANLHRLAANPDVGSFAIGICFQRSPTYPSGVYWSVMAFFPKGETRSGSR
jgi:Cysteine-rich secretory protein family